MAAMSSGGALEKTVSTELRDGSRLSRQQSRRKAVIPVIEMPGDESAHGGSAYVSPQSPGTATTLLFPHDAPINYERRSSSLNKLRSSISKIVDANRTSARFKTLRDQFGINEIELSELKTLKVIGEGAFATVEKCLYQPREWGGQQSKIVAVKKLKPNIVSNEPDLQSFMAEVSLMRKLKHKNIVGYVGIGSQDVSSPETRRSTMFLASELMEGGTLKALVTKEMLGAVGGGSLYSLRDAVQWCLQIAQGLEYLHSVRPIVVHRDLKLDNVLLTAALDFKEGGKPDRSTQIAKLADFGLVAFVKQRDLPRIMSNCTRSLKLEPDVDEDTLYNERSKMVMSMKMQDADMSTSFKRPTATGSMSGFNPTDVQIKGLLTGQTGTLMYMAPEMYREEQYDEKVDVFSWAICAYELCHKYMMIFAISVTGTEEEIMRYAQRVSQGFRPTLREDFPAELKSIIQEAWHEDPKKRPSMTMIVKRLQALLDSSDLKVSGEDGCCIVS